MKIIYILNSGDFGGMEKHVLDLCRGMAGLGHEVFVWCPAGDMAVSFEEVGAKVTRIGMRFDIDPIYIHRLISFLKVNNIEIVHAHELKASVNALIAGKLAGVKIRISHTHTPISEWQIPGWKKRLNVAVYSKMVNLLATYEIALTQSRKQIKLGEGIKEEKLIVLENANAVNISSLSLGSNIKAQYRQGMLAKLEIDHSSMVWGCVGRLSSEKGHEVLLEAFELFLRKLPEDQRASHHLILAGGGPLKDKLTKIIEKLNLDKKVTITGKLSANDVIKYYSTFNYFVHPSLAEGFGLVLIEAMAAGTPVIASDLEVFKEVGRDTILYFKTGQAEDLSRVMQEVVSGQHDVIRLTRLAHKRVVDNYSLDKFVESYNRFYTELLSQTSPV